MALMIVPAMAKTKPTVAIIKAEWCSACQKLEPTMMELMKEYGDKVEFVVLDVSSDDKVAEMLDVIQLPTPQFLANWNPERKGKGYVSALLIGASSGLVVGPCTAPALGAALAYVGTQGNVFFGTTVLFVFAIGMGTLMIALGTFSGALSALPRSGEWMVKVKKGFGFVMILIAQYLFVQAGQRFI
ncbi:MAG: cytochrome c biogenesis protein CcdA [Acidobacteriota bacterium]|nr:cytochrome c biogenesis protein CcdA [Acidobacteriota bacterium]